MRVSPAFKAIAAPLLYKTLSWKDVGRGNALGLVREGSVIEQRTKDMDSKETELKHIQMIEILYHTKEECDTTEPHLRQCPLVIPILRIDMRNNDERYIHGIAICLDCGRCPRLKGIQAKKLVVVANDHHYGFRLNHRIDSHVEELVVYLDLSECFWCRRYHTFPDTPSTRLVFVILNTDVVHPPPGSLRLFRSMQNLADQLVHHVRLHQFASDITLVSSEPLEYRRPRSEQVVTFEAMCRERSDSFEPRIEQLPNGRQWKTASEAALISYNCISLRDYLTGHDWKGVFTEKEAARLLQDGNPDNHAGG